MDRFTVSLASRIIMVATTFLILPLLFFMLFMYFHELRVKTRDAEIILQAVANERTMLIEQELNFHKQMLHVVEQGAPLTIYEKLTICTKAECQKLLDIAKPIGDGVLIAIGKWRFTLLKELPDGRYVTIETDVPHLVEKVPGVPDVSVYLLDEKRDVIAGSEEELPKHTHRIWVIKSIGAGGYRLLFDIPETVNYGDFFLRTAILFGLIVVVGGLAVFSLVRRINKPLHQLSNVMRQIGSGDLDARYKPDKMGFEINELGEGFNEMIGSAKSNIERERELLLGREVQQSLLPTALPDLPNLDIASTFIPAKDVGGDFFDLHRLSDGKLLIVMADACGKGISACLYALIARSLLRATEGNIQKANDLLMQDAKESGTFVTAWVGILDPTTMNLDYHNCGHNPALLKKSSGEILSLTNGGMALGVAEHKENRQKTALDIGDQLIVFTDGIVEAHNPQEELFGQERLKHAITGTTSQDITNSITSTVDKFSDSAAQHDDIALLVIKRVS